jgi:hypothetical protein
MRQKNCLDQQNPNTIKQWLHKNLTLIATKTNICEVKNSN